MIRNHQWCLSSAVIAFIIIGLTYSCHTNDNANNQKTEPEKRAKEQKDSVDVKNQNDTDLDQINQEQPKVERFSYPQMSLCGGGLEGIYSNNELIRIESTYGYDMGFSEKNIDFKKGRITKIEYREHYADWEKYNQRYGAEEGDLDVSKMTYVDTLYILNFEPKREFTIYSGKTKVNRKVTNELIDRLLECTAIMRKELSTERIKRQ